MIRDALIVFLIFVGTFFMFLGSFGIVRLPDFYTRVHAQTKSATLGLVSLLIAAGLSLATWETGFKAGLAVFFHFLTNPVGAHMITRAAYHHLKVKFWHNTIANEWSDPLS